MDPKQQLAIDQEKDKILGDILGVAMLTTSLATPS